MKKFLISMAAALVCIALAAGIFVFVTGREESGAGRSGETVSIEVPQGANASEIIDILKENEIIGIPLWYRFYLSKTQSASLMQSGTFELRKNMSYEEITKALTTPQIMRETVTVTFPEGSTAIQFANIMEQAGLCTAQEFLEVANNGDFSDLEFWNKIDRDEHCFMNAEGYLFPETYEFYKNDTVYNYVHKLYAQFDAEITDEMYARMDELGMTLNETITLASLIQEEAGDPVNMAPVSGVFHNRLQENSPYPKMGSDVTWYYIQDFIRPYYGGEEYVPAGMEDNYYTGDEDPNSRVGLPAGPLSCPGRDAVNAALYPDYQGKTYYFFLTDLTGKYYYAETYEQHLANIQTMKAVNAAVEQ